MSTFEDDYVRSVLDLVVGRQVRIEDTILPDRSIVGSSGTVVRYVKDPTGFVPYCVVVQVSTDREVAVAPSNVAVGVAQR